jgi:hypothetical protein
LPMVGGSHRVLRLLPPLKLHGRHDIAEILLKVFFTFTGDFFQKVWPLARNLDSYPQCLDVLSREIEKNLYIIYIKTLLF